MSSYNFMSDSEHNGNRTRRRLGSPDYRRSGSRNRGGIAGRHDENDANSDDTDTNVDEGSTLLGQNDQISRVRMRKHDAAPASPDRRGVRSRSQGRSRNMIGSGLGERGSTIRSRVRSIVCSPIGIVVISFLLINILAAMISVLIRSVVLRNSDLSSLVGTESLSGFDLLFYPQLAVTRGLIYVREWYTGANRVSLMSDTLATARSKYSKETLVMADEFEQGDPVFSIGGQPGNGVAASRTGLDLSFWEPLQGSGSASSMELHWLVNNRSVAYVHKGHLYLKPQLTSSYFGLSAGATAGRVDFWGNDPPSQCTQRSRDGCVRIDDGMPPVVSAGLRTRSFAFRYGRVEVRARLPAGKWLAPSITLRPRFSQYGSGDNGLGGSGGPVVWVVRAKGNDEGRDVRAGASVAALDKKAKIEGKKSVSAGSSDFHVFGLVWDPEGMRGYVDTDDAKGRIWETKFAPNTDESLSNPFRGGSDAAPFDEEYYVQIEMVVGGDLFNDDTGRPWGNNYEDGLKSFLAAKNNWHSTWSTEDRHALAVDYIRVWQTTAGGDQSVGLSGERAFLRTNSIYPHLWALEPNAGPAVPQAVRSGLLRRLMVRALDRRLSETADMSDTKSAGEALLIYLETARRNRLTRNSGCGGNTTSLNCSSGPNTALNEQTENEQMWDELNRMSGVGILLNRFAIRRGENLEKSIREIMNGTRNKEPASLRGADASGNVSASSADLDVGSLRSGVCRIYLNVSVDLKGDCEDMKISTSAQNTRNISTQAFVPTDINDESG